MNDDNFKARYWWFILYPESANPDWLLELQFLGIPSVVSPLHDKDIDFSGDFKKPHHHIILAYDGPTTFNNVKRFCVQTLHATIPKRLASIQKPYEYLWHKNEDPQAKHVYDPKDLLFINDFNIINYDHNTSIDTLELQRSIIEDIDRWKVTEYYSLIKIYMNLDIEKFQFVSSHTIFIKSLLQSRKFISKDDLDRIEEITQNE